MGDPNVCGNKYAQPKFVWNRRPDLCGLGRVLSSFALELIPDIYGK